MRKTKKRGAGERQQHYIQDACELFLVLKLQETFEMTERHISLTSTRLRAEFEGYCVDRHIGFLIDDTTNVYKTNVLLHASTIANETMEKYPTKYINARNVEVVFRNSGRKGDFALIFSDEQGVALSENIMDLEYRRFGRDLSSGICYKSFSLKNYKNGFKTTQCCSGTFLSFLYHFYLESAGGPGQFIDPVTQKSFNPSRNKELRDDVFATMDLYDVADVCHILDQDLTDVKTFYHGDEAMMWQDIHERWFEDCEKYSKKTAALIIDNLKSNLSDSDVRNIILKRAGLDSECEDYLYISPKNKEMSILYNKRTLLYHPDTVFSYGLSATERDIIFNFTNGGTKVVSIRTPFTLQKNGAWFLPKTEYTGTQFHSKEKVELFYGQRRPKKSKELNTSTNTYVTWY